MNKSQTVNKLAEALSKAQAEMPVVRMNAQNPFLKNKYADLGAVIQTSRPILAKHGLAITQFPTSEGEKIGVTSTLLHVSGEWMENSVFINLTDSKGLSVAQTAGVVISYLRRYAWASILGLYADEDTDGSHPETEQRQKSSKRQSYIDRYSELVAEAKKLDVEVHPINPKMTDLEIVEAGKELSDRLNARKAGNND